MKSTPDRLIPALLAACLVASYQVSARDHARLTGTSQAAGIYQVIPGTRTPDYGRRVGEIRDGVVYPTIPGTRTPDYGSPRATLCNGTLNPVIPGTRTPDPGAASHWLER
ncbi:hypothetical protein [Lamprocystis purpurea]|jgi:hypothetical protein|uniref:hypothetical protein n=1 Tax=Lamprocystis purpurea TaxID=61598 RepID=UPI0012F7E895|nr:hypothetical protein [Lamprocystis purpurea]